MRMAIVSSYSDSCGNAAFTRVLHDTIEQYAQYDVEVIDLNLGILQSLDSASRKAAEKHVDDICKRLATFDLVNIQLEAGLYGIHPVDIFARLKRMMGSNPNTTVTLHSPRLVGDGTELRKAVSAVFRFRPKTAIVSYLNHYKRNVHVRLNRKLVSEIVRLNAQAIVHTGRAKTQIKTFFDYDNVAVHPLRIVREGFTPNPQVMASIRTQLGFAEDDVLVGMFGYITSNKGHIDALAAMALLPKNYKLLIFGRQHPQTIRTDGSRDEYLAKLVTISENSKRLAGRIFFMGELSDADFVNVAASVDAAWLPYYENGQDGSGIASICMDVCPRVLASTSFAFDELNKLISYKNVIRFDIGNELELATKTEMIMRRPLPALPYGDESVYNIGRQALVYAKQLEQVTPSAKPLPLAAE